MPSGGYDTAMPPYTMVDSGLLALRYKDRDVLLLSHPRELRRRVGLTLSVSLDQGKTWTLHKNLNNDGAD